MAKQIKVRLISGKTGIIVGTNPDNPFQLIVRTGEKTVCVYTDEVEIVEELEFSVSKEPEKCGLGKGPDCCIYLVSSGYFECARGGPLYNAIEKRKSDMRSKYRPTQPYPDCLRTFTP